MKKSQLEQVSKALSHLHACEFGGKPQGRFKIKRASFLKLCGMKRMTSEDVTAIANFAFENANFVVSDLGDYLSVCSVFAHNSYRAVPKAVVESYLQSKAV